MEPRGARIAVRVMTWITLLFLYIPLVIIVVYAFNDSIGQKWPLEGRDDAVVRGRVAKTAKCVRAWRTR